MTSRYTDPEYPRSALITVDAQSDTLDGGALEVAGTSAALVNMLALVGAFRTMARPIVHIVRLYESDGSNVDLCRRGAVERGVTMLAPGSPGSELAGGLSPRAEQRLDTERLLAGRVQQLTETEAVIYKPRWGAFYETPLDEHLREHGVTTLVFCGCNFPNCPRTSIYEASERDYRIVLARDAISGLYERGEDELRNVGVRILDSAEIVTNMAKSSTAI